MPEGQSYTVFETAWGAFGVVVRKARIVSIMLPMGRRALHKRVRTEWPDAEEVPNLLPAFRREVVNYFAGEEPQFTAPLDFMGLPAFRRKVLEACRRIPYGSTASYGDLARAVGKAGAARAVGGAMAANPFPLVIPCHRVLRSDGSIGGFSSPAGVKLKTRMLELEGASFADS